MRQKTKRTKICLRLQGEFSKPFAKAIEEHEGLKIEFRFTNGVVWTKPSRASTPYLRINGYCNVCKSTKNPEFVKYKITIEKNTSDQKSQDYSATTFINARVEKTNEHIHTGKKAKAQSNSKKSTTWSKKMLSS